MNNNSGEDKLIFKILFFICYTFHWSILALLHPESDFGYPYAFFSFFFAIMPIFFLMNKKRIYVYIFCLYLIIIHFLMQVIVFRITLYLWHRSNYLLFFWQIMFTLFVIEIYFGFKIMIKEHLNYRKLPLEEKEKLKSAEEIGLRILYFIICLFVYIFSFIVSMIIFDKIYYRNI